MAARRAARCSAVSAVTKSQTTSTAALTSCGSSSCLTGRSTRQALQPTSLKVRKVTLTYVSFKWSTINCDLLFSRNGRVLQAGQRSLQTALPEHAGQLQMCLWPRLRAGSGQTQLWEWVGRKHNQQSPHTLKVYEGLVSLVMIDYTSAYWSMCMIYPSTPLKSILICRF